MQRSVGSEDGIDQEVLAYDKNGDEIWLSARVKAFRNARGRVKYLLALITDITETRQLWSLQQLIMTALADEIPITDIADQLCRRVEEMAPDVVSSLLHIDAAGLVSWARERLAGFKCPTGVTVVSELPRNATGKFLKRVLREPYWQGRERQVN